MSWIKIRTNLATDPAVSRMALILKTPARQVVGCLVAVWCWADELTADGYIEHASLEQIDEIAGKKGFASAMVTVGWLASNDAGVVLPKWDRHNGQSAKARAGEAERKRLQRQDTQSGKCPDKRPDAELDKKPDQRRGEEIRDKEEEEERVREESPSLQLDGLKAAEPLKLRWSADLGWEGVTEEHRATWLQAYPACHIARQLAQMDAWLRANPREAHKSNWLRFITNWLKREQDRGGDVRTDRRTVNQPTRPTGGHPFQMKAATQEDHAKGFFS